jgi:preprotein translocase subunit Sss1
LAVEQWVQDSNTIVYDKKIYDEISNKWLKNYSYTKNQSPSEQEAFKEYKKILNISKDSKTQFITISITHNSPFLAKEWLEIIIKNINESMRERDKKLALSYIDFLNKSSQEAKVKGIKEGISQLLEVQMQKLMLTSANKNYIFKTIDSPIASEYKSSPNRFLIIIIGTIFIGLIGAIISLSVFFYKKSIK